MASKFSTSCTSEELFDHQCSSCQTKDKNVEAYTFCADCQDYYCETCRDLIHRAPALRNHKLITTDDAVNGGKLPSVPTSRCEKHAYKIIDMYCQDDDQVGCNICMRVDHESCAVVYIPEFVQTNNDIHRQFIQAMQNKETQLQDCLGRFRLEQNRLGLDKDVAIDRINTMRAKLEDAIRKKAELAIKKVEGKYKQTNKDFRDKIATINSQIDNISKRYKDIEVCSPNVPQAFVLSKMSKECISEAERVRVEMKQVPLGRVLLFKPNTNYDAILSDTETSLGDVQITSYIYTFGEIEYVNTKGIKLRGLYLNDSCSTSDGSIYFTAGYLLIRVCNTKMEVVEHFKLDATPKGVCCISDKEIAVCMGKTIQMFNTENRLHCTRSIDINYYCLRISYHYGMFYVADTRTVYKYNMDGSLLKKYDIDTGTQSVPWLYQFFEKRRSSDISRLVVNPINDNIHIVYDDSVITMDQEGSIVNNISIHQPCGICVDNYGNVLVSTLTSGIIQLNCNGKYMKEVIKRRELHGAGALCFDKTCRRLYVGNRWGREIIVFNVK